MQKRVFTKEFKLQIVQELQSGKSVLEVCKEHDIQSTLACRWRHEYQQNPEHAFSGKGNPSKENTKIALFERKIGQLYLENEFIKKVNANLQARLAELKKTR